MFCKQDVHNLVLSYMYDVRLKNVQITLQLLHQPMKFIFPILGMQGHQGLPGMIAINIMLHSQELHFVSLHKEIAPIRSLNPGGFSKHEFNHEYEINNIQSPWQLIFFCLEHKVVK